MIIGYYKYRIDYNLRSLDRFILIMEFKELSDKEKSLEKNFKLISLTIAYAFIIIIM